MNKQALNIIGSAFEKLAGITSLASIEIIQSSAEADEALVSQIFSEGYTPAPFSNIKNEEKLKTAIEGEPVVLQKNAQGGSSIYLAVIPLIKKESTYYLVAQSAAEIFETDSVMLSVIGKIISAQSKELFGAVHEGETRYKEELMKVRNSQARLFPKFDNLQGIDAAAIYLPADLMTGDFVDALYLNKEIYQITTCDISGQDASSSFAGAAVRTLVRTFSNATTMPSALIELINTRIQKLIAGINQLLYLSVFQINTRTGKTTVSSYGDINTIYYSVKKKGYIHINKTPVGENLAKKVVFKDISLILEPGDSLLYYTRGVKNAASEDKSQTYGEERIIQNFKTNIQSEPLELVHSLSETIYEFTNYSNPAQDIILLCIRKL